MTILLDVDSERDAEQVIKQLHKQIDVIKVFDITEQAIIARELVLIRVNSPLSTRAEVFTLIEPFRATVVDVTRESITIQATGHPDKIEALIGLLRPYGIKDIARTGVTAFAREADRQTEGKSKPHAIVTTVTSAVVYTGNTESFEEREDYHGKNVLRQRRIARDTL